MLDVKCPKCNEITKVFLLDGKYSDPFLCWKCKAAFRLEIDGNEIKSTVLMSQEDFDKWRELQQLKKDK